MPCSTQGVTKNGYAIQCIENPSEELQLAAVTQNGHAIQCIKNPSEAAKIAAKIIISFLKHKEKNV